MSRVSISTRVKTCQLILNSQTSVPTSFSYKGPPVTSKTSKLIAGNPFEQSGFVNIFQILALQFFVNQHHFVRYKILNFAHVSRFDVGDDIHETPQALTHYETVRAVSEDVAGQLMLRLDPVSNDI